MDYKLKIQLVPTPIWGLNLRWVWTKKRWTEYRAELIAERGLRCECCGVDVSTPSKIHAHEEWEYDTSARPAKARLAGISLCCWLCHQCEHFGHLRTLVRKGKVGEQAIEEVIEHFCRVNGVDRAAFYEHRKAANEEWRRQCALDWVIDWGPFQETIPARDLMGYFDPDGNPVRWLSFANVDQDVVSAFLTDLVRLSRFYGVWIGQTNRQKNLPLHIRPRCTGQGSYLGQLRIPQFPISDAYSAVNEMGAFMVWDQDPVQPKALENGSSGRYDADGEYVIQEGLLRPEPESVFLAQAKFNSADGLGMDNAAAASAPAPAE